MTAGALARIRARGHIGIRLGLDRMRALLAQIDDPQASLRGVLIAGTNGKGSVAAIVASTLQAAGLSTLQSPSPHLHSYRERIIVDGLPIGTADLDGLLEEVLTASEPGSAEHGPATEFELLTAAAYLWAARRSVDVTVMEVGLGGRLDASNVWDPDVAAITNVGLDHQEFLGHTVTAVAAEKAAIIKPGARAVTAAGEPGLSVIAARAAEVGAPLDVRSPLRVMSMDTSGLVLADAQRGRLELPLLGRHQAANTSVALGILDALRQADVAAVSDDAVRTGLAATRWPGRLELRSTDGITVLLDGAHNPDGVHALVDTIEALSGSLPPGRTTLLMGVMADKEAEQMVHILAAAPHLKDAKFVATTVPDSDRALPANALAAMWPDAYATRSAGIEAIDAATAAAIESARREGGLLVVVGSLYLVGDVRERLLPAKVPSS